LTGFLFCGYDIVMTIDDEFMDDIDEEEELDADAITYACEDCDHRWEPDELDEMICPMCGSANIVEL